MIQVIDIPLNLRAADVRSSFKRCGTITKISLVTKGLYQQAYISFSDNSAFAHFSNKAWSNFIYNDAVRVLPMTLNKEQRSLRQDHCFKLAGLPRNTSARNLLYYFGMI